MAISTAIAVVGIAAAWACYVKSPSIPRNTATALKPLFALSLNKLYLDEIFTWLVVAPLQWLARLATQFDALVIDPIVDGVGKIPRLVSSAPRRLHHGLVPVYGVVMWTGLVLGVLAMLGVFHR
jgi:NADH-quinone oxidoreductase subunit L